MRTFNSLTAATLLVLLAATPARAEVVTTLQFFGAFTVDQTFTKDDIRVVSDSKSRNDATARATAEASADIGTGELKAKATGEKLVPGELETAARASGSAVDTLTIDGPGTDAIPVSFQMAVDGDLILPGSASGQGGAFATVQAVLGIVGDSETATLQFRRRYDVSGAIVSESLTGIGDWQGAVPTGASGTHYDLLLQFDTEIVPGTPFEFESELIALVGSGGDVGSDAISDFGNTGKFTIILPPAYTLTSQSGVFLAGPIPEPSTWAMLACGLGCVALFVHRRRRR